MKNWNLAVSDEDLTRLADDLNAMQSHLDKQVRRMDAVVDKAEARWRSDAAVAFRRLQREAGEDAVRIRGILAVLEQAVRMGRDGFSRQELDVLQQMRRAQRSTDAAAEVRELSGEPPAPASPAPRSKIDDI
ncbi:WXG100 family type VII secretion target [Streptomyces sp. WAC01280]|uniref:WXG100 family type VII secretion target n=1 Tax=Streptomyces sp. WAC01280 TaxID=2487424 RepID=UPI0021B08BF6|nr:WXG100 family type VII secretion target [Streptomyces sp. WAC01280]